MRLIIILLLLSVNCFGTTYYVSNTGSNAANGTTTGTSWQTISKVNSSTTSGDTVLFKCGDTWNERLNVPGSNMYFGSYSTGVKPVITGLQTLSGFTNVGNIWSVTATNSVPQLNTVLVGGTIRAKGRFPNTGWSTFAANSGKTQITTGLSGTPNYTGAECVVRNAHWIIDVCKISSQSGGVLNFSNEMTYATPLAFGANGYFIQNVESALDVAGEWCYDSTSKVLKVYSTTTPTVQISTIDTLVYVNNKVNVNFNGLSFTGANKAAIQIDTSNNVLIDNCYFNNSGTLAISGAKSAYVTISNDTILNSLSGGVYLRAVNPYTAMVDTCNFAIVSNNYIKNTGHLAGMGMNSNGRYFAVYVVGTAPQITGNTIDSTGYVPILFNGKNSYVYKNFVSNFAFVKDDGGGIYTVVGNYIPTDYNDGSIIRKNIVINGIGAQAGTSNQSFSPGIYTDDLCRYITIDSNTISNCNQSSLYLHNSTYITAKDNLIVDSIGVGLYILETSNNQNIKNNIFYSKNANFANVYRQVGTSVATIDSNYYSLPTNESKSFNMNGTYYSLSGWKTLTGQDLNSSGTPLGVTAATPLFYYNPTNSDSTISIGGRYLNSKSEIFNNSVTLKPFASVVLYKSIIEIISNYQLKFRRIKR